MPKKLDGKTALLTVRVKPEELAAINAAASQRDATASRLVRDALSKHAGIQLS